MNKQMNYYGEDVRELSLNEVVELIKKAFQKYTSSADNNETLIRAELIKYSELLNEIDTIQETVRLGFLKDFKIKRAMIPNEFETVDELRERVNSLTEKLHELEEVTPVKMLQKENWRLYEVLNRASLSHLFGLTPQNRFFNTVITSEYRGDYTLMVRPVSPLGFLALDFQSYMDYDFGELSIFHPSRLTSDLNANRKYIAECAQACLAGQADLSKKLLAKNILENVDLISQADLEDLAYELATSARFANSKLAEEVADRRFPKMGDNENGFDKMRRRYPANYSGSQFLEDIFNSL